MPTKRSRRRPIVEKNEVMAEGAVGGGVKHPRDDNNGEEKGAEHDTKRAKNDTVWAMILEQQPNASEFKLRLKPAEYSCSSNIDHLETAISNVIGDRGYFVPDRIDIFGSNPFVEREVFKRDMVMVYHFSNRVRSFDNMRKIKKGERSHKSLFYVLVSPLRSKLAQPPMEAVTLYAGTQALLNWSRENFPSLPVDPLDFVRAKFPSEPISTIEFVTPTANLVRQGREQEVREAWRCMYQNAPQHVRRSMPYIFGTPGSGKTALLKYIFERSDRDLLCNEFTAAQREWIRNVEVFAITFSGTSPVTGFDLRMLITETMELVPVVMRLLFAQQSAVSWDDFSRTLARALDVGIINEFKLSSLTWIFERLGLWGCSAEEQKYVVLLVDELVKVEDRLKEKRQAAGEAEAAVHNLRHHLCVKMDTKPFQLLFSTLSVKPMDLETKSNRIVKRLGLPLLNFEEAEALFKSELSHGFFIGPNPADGDSQAHIYAWLARLSGGHPRTIEQLCRTCNQLAEDGRYQAKHIVQNAAENIMKQYYANWTNYPWGLFLAVLVGRNVLVTSQIPGENSIGPHDFDEAIEFGYVINSASKAAQEQESKTQESETLEDSTQEMDEATIQPRVSELQLRTLLHVLPAHRREARQPNAHKIFDPLRTLLGKVDDIDGKKFETFHMNWEIMRRNAIVEAKTWPNSTVVEFYGCSRYCGQLAKTLVVLTQAPECCRYFPRVKSWTVTSKRFSECPPGRNLGTTLLRYVWYPERHDFPGIDFVIFVLAHDGRIIPLVFQSKYSADDSTTELGNSTVSDAYKVAKGIMAHARWQPNEFIFVVHAYRETTGNILPKEPTRRSARTAPNSETVANIMLLDKPTLQRLYGSLGFTIKYAWLRRQVA